MLVDASVHFSHPVSSTRALMSQPGPCVLRSEPASMSHGGRVFVDRELVRNNELYDYSIGPIKVWSYAGRVDPTERSVERP